jgi:hypothetical protein
VSGGMTDPVAGTLTAHSARPSAGHMFVTN